MVKRLQGKEKSLGAVQSPQRFTDLFHKYKYNLQQDNSQFYRTDGLSMYKHDNVRR
jgi:hypothetical protein